MLQVLKADFVSICYDLHSLIHEILKLVQSYTLGGNINICCDSAPPSSLILGCSASKETSETMDVNKMNKINIGRMCKAFDMKNHYSNENSLKWLQVEACKTCSFGTTTIFTLANHMFDISVRFLCLLMNVCFRTVAIVQHCIACQRASQIFLSSVDVSKSLDTFFNNFFVTLLLKCQLSCI